MSNIERLNRDFGAAGVRFVEGPGGLVVAEVNNAHAGARIALQGAHVLSYQKNGEAPIIWLSRFAKYAVGKSVRGGVPVCWPWFGPHASNPKFPGHGFARTVPWRVVQVSALADGSTCLEFQLEQSAETRAQWPHASDVRNIVTVGAKLTVELLTTNTGSEAFPLGQALHTYFDIGDVRRAVVNGLDGCDYIDKVDGGRRKRQQGAVTFHGETDRIYLATGNRCEIKDPAMNRTIVIESRGSRSTVVWNPWHEKADKMGDFGPDGWTGMVCVETANAADDIRTLAPGDRHSLTAIYASAPL